MLRRTGWILIPIALLGAAEIIDRVAVKFGNQAITESAIRLEIRLAAFLNGEPPDLSSASRRKAAERMVDQVLMRNEMVVSQYPTPETSAVDEYLATVRKQRFASEAEYRAALATYGIGEEALKEHLLRQISILRFIEIRFRPGVQFLDTEVREYYDKRFVPEWQNKTRRPLPVFEDARPEIEKILLNERVDRAVENWLQEARSRTRIQFMEKAFQ